MGDEFIIGNEGEDRERPPVGMTRAICIGVHNLGWQIGFEGAIVKKVLYLWEIEPRLTTGEHVGKRHLVSRSFKQSMHPKADHAKMLKSWNAKDFSDEERKAHNVYQYINKPCLINLEWSKDQKYVNVGSVLPPMEGMEPLIRETPSDYTPAWILKKVEEGKTKPASTEPEKINTVQVEPAMSEIDTARAAAKEELHFCHECGLFSKEEETMKKALIENKDNLPSLRFLASDWKEKRNKRGQEEMLRINTAVP